MCDTKAEKMEQSVVFKWDDISGKPKESNKEIYKKIVDEIYKEAEKDGIFENKYMDIKRFEELSRAPEYFFILGDEKIYKYQAKYCLWLWFFDDLVDNNNSTIEYVKNIVDEMDILVEDIKQQIITGNNINIQIQKYNYIVKNFATFVCCLFNLIKNKVNSKEWWNRFLNNHIKYMKHSLIVKQNSSNSDLSFNLALEYRLYDSACYQCFDLFELQIDDFLDDKSYFSKIYSKLRFLANKNISLVNDIYSWPKDHYNDNLTNLIIDRVAKEQGSLSDASSYLLNIINNDILIFDHLSKSVTHNHPSLQKLIFMLKWNMVSHWNWALSTNRYKHKFSLLPEFLI